jgi:hypothetical protein
MVYTERDLLIVERTVAALEKLIAEQEARFSTINWEPDQRSELDALLKQFREALQMQRDKYSEIWSSLHGNDPDLRKRRTTGRLNQPRRR